MSHTKKLQAIDVKNEVKRIKKLPRNKQEGQMDALCNRIKSEIDAYYDKLGTITLEEQNSEYLRIHRCVSAHKWKWEVQLWDYIEVKRSEQSECVENKKLQAEDVENEVKRIEKLSAEEREAQMEALSAKIRIEIDNYYYLLNTMTLSEQDGEYTRLSRCISAHSQWEVKLWDYFNAQKSEKNIIAKIKTGKLRAKDVKNEVRRIEILPPDQQEVQMDALCNRIKTEIDTHYEQIDTMTLDEQSSGNTRLTWCISALKGKWEKQLRAYESGKKSEWWEKKSGDSNGSYAKHYVDKTNTAHISGLPLPKQAEVDIWWQEDKLIFQSRATEFSLPVERVLGMGMTKEVSPYWQKGDKTYLTIEYKKEDEIKSIVVRAMWRLQFNHLIKYFDQIKGTREMNKQEL